MNIDALTGQFHEQGFLHLPRHFSVEMMRSYNQLIEAHFKSQPGYVHNDEFLSQAATEVIPWFPQREGVGRFDRIEQDEVFTTITENILGEGWQSQYCMVMYSHPGSSGQAWHQDCPPDNPGVFNMNRLVYTHAIDPSVGGEVVVVPGSHLMGELSAGDPHEEIPGQIVIAPQQGDCLFLHGHTWHRVLALKDGHRYSTNYRAAPRGTPEDITDVCVYRNMRYRFSTAEVIEQRMI